MSRAIGPGRCLARAGHDTVGRAARLGVVRRRARGSIEIHRDVAFHGDELLVFENDGYAPGLDVGCTALFKRIEVVPAIVVERIRDQGCAEYKTYLAAVHTEPKPFEHFRGDHIPLLNVGLIYREASRRECRDHEAGGEQ